jgi:hypothetical protein
MVQLALIFILKTVRRNGKPSSKNCCLKKEDLVPKSPKNLTWQLKLGAKVLWTLTITKHLTLLTPRLLFLVKAVEELFSLKA